MSRYCLKIGIIGSGYMANEHAQAFLSIEGVELSGVFSRNAETSKKMALKFGIANVCSSVDELYEKAQPDVLVVCTPELETLNVCRLAFKYPWTILIEKPAGYNLEESIEMLSLSEKENAKVFVAFNRRFYSSTLRMKDSLRADDSPRLIEIRDQEDAVAALKAGQPELVVKNWMFANSIHLVDLFYEFGRGEIKSVESSVAWDGASPDYVHSVIKFESGDIGIYTACWNMAGPWRVSINAGGNFYEMRPVEDFSEIKFGTRQVVKYERSKLDLDYKPGLRLMADEVIKAVKGESSTLPTLRDSLASMQLVSDIYALT